MFFWNRKKKEVHFLEESIEMLSKFLSKYVLIPEIPLKDKELCLQEIDKLIQEARLILTELEKKDGADKNLLKRIQDYALNGNIFTSKMRKTIIDYCEEIKE